MATTRVAHRYAKALMDMAKEEGSFDAVVEDIRTVSAALEGSPDLRRTLITPVIDDRTKERILREIFAGKVGTIMDRFISLLTLKGRARDLVDIGTAFEHLLDIERNTMPVTITIAAELGEEQRRKIEDHIRKLSGGNIRAEYKVDPSIIGGFSARFGDTMVDASIRHQLERLRTTLMTGTGN